MRHVKGATYGTLAFLILALAGCGGAAAPTSAPASASAASKAASASQAASASAKPSAAASASQPASASAAASKPAASPSGPSIKVGYILPLSGPVAVYGQGIKYASTMVANEVNASGGINGSPMEVVTLDSPNNANQSVTDIRRLANEDKVFALVGPYYTGELQAAVPILNDLKLPTVAYTPGASYPGFVKPSQWVVLADTNDEITADLALDGFKKAYPNVKKMAIVGDVQTAVTALMIKTIWPKIVPAKGYQVVDTVTYQYDTTDFSPIVTRIKGSGAEGIALSSLSPGGPSLLKEMERQGLKLPVVASSHLLTVPPLPAILGKTADGLVQTNFFSPDEAQKPDVKAWMDKYAALVVADKPGEKPLIGYANEPQAYDAFQAVARALRDSGVKPSTPVADARESIRQALLKIKDLPGVMRKKQVTVDSDGQPRITWDMYALIAKDGVYQTIK